LFFKVPQRAPFHTFTLPNDRRLGSIFLLSPNSARGIHMFTKFAAALALMTLAGAVSASVVVQTPEIDPASAMAGLTLLAGGLAVLRGRIAKKIAN
jgi:hypothetical protein